MAGSRNAVPRRTYRERPQTARRLLRFPFLEKKRDWQIRSRRWKARQQLLQYLAEKARCRNEEEFSYRMLKAKQVGGGVDGLGGKTAGGTYMLSATQAAVSNSCSGTTQASSAAALQKVRRRRLQRAATEQQQLQLNMRFLQHKQQILRKRMEKTLTDAAAAAYVAVADNSNATLSPSSSSSAAASGSLKTTRYAQEGGDEGDSTSEVHETGESASDSSGDSEEEGKSGGEPAGGRDTGSTNGAAGETSSAVAFATGRRQGDCEGQQQGGLQQPVRKSCNGVSVSSHADTDTSTGEVSVAADQQQGCRWQWRAAAAKDRSRDYDTETDNSSVSDAVSTRSADADEDDNEEQLTGDEKEERGRKVGYTISKMRSSKGKSNGKDRKSKTSWVGQLQDDCEHVKRVRMMLAKLQLKKDLNSKGRRTKVHTGDGTSSRSATVYKWFAERKK